MGKFPLYLFVFVFPLYLYVNPLYLFVFICILFVFIALPSICNYIVILFIVWIFHLKVRSMESDMFLVYCCVPPSPQSDPLLLIKGINGVVVKWEGNRALAMERGEEVERVWPSRPCNHHFSPALLPKGSGKVQAKQSQNPPAMWGPENNTALRISTLIRQNYRSLSCLEGKEHLVTVSKERETTRNLFSVGSGRVQF